MLGVSKTRTAACESGGEAEQTRSQEGGGRVWSSTDASSLQRTMDKYRAAKSGGGAMGNDRAAVGEEGGKPFVGEEGAGGGKG